MMCRLILFLALSLAVQAQPNVVLIAVDDLNDWVGCLKGHPQVKTPHLDRLAARGLLFSNAHCQAPLCNPSRTSLITGRRPGSTGIYGNLREFTGLPRGFAAFRSCMIYLPFRKSFAPTATTRPFLGKSITRILPPPTVRLSLMSMAQPVTSARCQSRKYPLRSKPNA